MMLNLRTDLAHPDSGLSPGEEAGACAWVSGMGSCGVCRGIQGPVAPSPGLESRAHLGNPEIQEVKWVWVWQEEAHIGLRQGTPPLCRLCVRPPSHPPWLLQPLLL